MLKLNKVIHLFTPGPIGGAERLIVAGLDALRSSGMETELWIIKEERVPHITESFLSMCQQQNLKVRIFNCRGILDLNLIQDLKRAFWEEKPMVIHAHGFKAIFYGKLSCPKITKFVVTHHGKTSHTWKVRMYERLETFIMKRSDAVIAVSSPMKEELTNDNIIPSKLHLIENILVIKPTHCRPTNESELKLVFVGRLSPEKGCLDLIRAISLVYEEVPLHVMIIGDGEERMRLQQLTFDLKINRHISFLGFQKDVVPFLSSAHAIVMPSLREGMPLALIEACCMGLPVIGTKVGGIPHLVQHGRNGLLVTPNAPEVLASGILEFSQYRKKFQRNSEEMISDFQARFSPINWVELTTQVYQTVLSHS